MTRHPRIEWPTLALIGLCWTFWALATAFAGMLGSVATIIVLSLCLALFSSLQHEVLHGHPTSNATLNHVLVALPVGLFIPYERFRDLHLAHHGNPNLTDPYDDPESWYLHPHDWSRCPAAVRLLWSWNNTLAGRVVAGPALGLAGFWSSELRRVVAGDRRVLAVWLAHFALLVPVIGWLALIYQAPWWSYPVAAYAALSIIYVRTFAEHRAHEDEGARTAVIEDHGPFALIFLNNNLHAVHHLRPGLPWYQLPRYYAKHRDRILAHNGQYRFRGYGELFRRYLFRRKEPVVHPLVEGGTGQ